MQFWLSQGYMLQRSVIWFHHIEFNAECDCRMSSGICVTQTLTCLHPMRSGTQMTLVNGGSMGFHCSWRSWKGWEKREPWQWSKWPIFFTHYKWWAYPAQHVTSTSVVKTEALWSCFNNWIHRWSSVSWHSQGNPASFHCFSLLTVICLCWFYSSVLFLVLCNCYQKIQQCFNIFMPTATIGSCLNWPASQKTVSIN